MRVVSLGFAMLASGRDVTGSGSCIYDNGYYLIIKSYSSVVVVKFTTKAALHQSPYRTIQVGLSLSYTETDGTRNQSYISIVRTVTVNDGLDRIME
jgi:hypothetical protein